MASLLRFVSLRPLVPLAGALALFAVGCGAYEPEPEVPHAYIPPPPTSEELAEQQRIAAANAQAQRPPAEQGAAEVDPDDADPSALTEFKPVLDPHGAWVEDPVYGTVWVPSESEVGTDFTPYVTAGHWTYTEAQGNVWVSDYSWGYVPFHYGRWVLVSGRGWCWIPGRRYAGAWVVWRTGPTGYGYVGWAPAPPLWYWSGRSAIWFHHGYYAPYYTYCSTYDLYHPTVYHRVVRGPSVVRIEGGTRPYQPPGRVVASPTVDGNGRVIADPSVGGGRVVASPSVGGASAFSGPRPSDLGLKQEQVAKTPESHPGLDKARAFARPERRPVPVDATGALANGPRRIDTGPGYAHAPPTDYNRSYTRPTYVPPQTSAPSRSTLGPPPRSTMATRPSLTDPSGITSAPSAPYRSYSTSPTFAPSRSYSSYRSSSSFPSTRATPTYRSSSPTFRSSGSSVFRSSSPTYRSSGSSVFRSSSPSVRSSPPRSVFRSGPRSSVFRSSSPSRSVFRSSPSVRSSGGFRRSRR